ncbi:MAG TPA: hypothetical protein PKD19_00865 [Candidatus Saccharibacteria bacterium]|jgi:hypothetical protein|nr:hypothetical protein [Candidatus Saccharibacteria bacterium]HMR38217.1 hypothetical protein [Candidatus Saccharibacteria bacterium]
MARDTLDSKQSKQMLVHGVKLWRTAEMMRLENDDPSLGAVEALGAGASFAFAARRQRLYGGDRALAPLSNVLNSLMGKGAVAGVQLSGDMMRIGVDESPIGFSVQKGTIGTRGYETDVYRQTGEQRIGIPLHELMSGDDARRYKKDLHERFMSLTSGDFVLRRITELSGREMNSLGATIGDARRTLIERMPDSDGTIAEGRRLMQSFELPGGLQARFSTHHGSDMYDAFTGAAAPAVTTTLFTVKNQNQQSVSLYDRDTGKGHYVSCRTAKSTFYPDGRSLDMKDSTTVAALMDAVARGAVFYDGTPIVPEDAMSIQLVENIQGILKSQL